MRSIFNGWVVRNHGGQWELLVQRVISPRLPGLGLAVGGHTNPGESLDACMVRTLREALGVSEAARVERIGREVFQADEFEEEDEEIVDLLIEVPTSGPERWRSTQKAPELSNQSFELDSEWRPLAERIELNGSGAAETLAEVRRRLGAPAPAPYVIVRWRADPDIEADPDEVAATLLAGRSHPAVLPMRSDEIPKDWDRLLPSATFVRDGPKAVGIVFRIAPDLDENARDQRVDWAMAPWPTDPLVAYDPQRRRFYQANWSTWRNYGPALARCPGVMVDFDAEFIGALMDAWQRPLMVWDHLPPFDADGNPIDRFAEDAPRQRLRRHWPARANQRAIRTLDGSVRNFMWGNDSLIVDADAGIRVSDEVEAGRAVVDENWVGQRRWEELASQFGWVMTPTGADDLWCLLVADPANEWLVESIKAWCRGRGRGWHTFLWRDDELIAVSEPAPDAPR